MIRTTVNREYKSNLFAMIFSDRENALSLYNSINGTAYENPQDLEFNTIGDVVYMGMKNDVSFLFGGDMNLYEGQSTWNPNMPLRGLFYFSMLYQAYVRVHRLNIYSNVRLSLPPGAGTHLIRSGRRGGTGMHRNEYFEGVSDQAQIGGV